MEKKSAKIQIKQIAEMVGMSQSTVSIVLNGRGDEMRISKETQKRIQEVAKSLDYRPNIYARRLRNTSEKQPNQMIAVFWNDSFMEDTMSRFFKGASTAVKENKYGVEFMIQLFSAGNLKEYGELLNIQKYNGIIIAGAFEEDMRFLEQGRFDIPIVLSSRSSDRFSSVYVDGYMIGYECAKLFSQKGLKSAGLFGVRQGATSSSLRELGFMNGCREYGIDIREDWIFKSETRNMEDGYQCAKELLLLQKKPEALFIMYDSMALGAVFAFKEDYIRIPEELSIIVYGLNNMLELTSPSFTMVGNSMETAGKNSVELLMTIIHNNIMMPISRVIEPAYIYGNSFSVQNT